jgi:ferredoxin
MSRITFVCSCEDTMAPDGQVIARACQGEIRGATQLCGAELARFQEALAEGRPITVACTAQAPLFEQEGEGAALSFVNIRERAGWSREGAAASAKMAALIAAAEVAMPATPLVPLKSDGVALILGRDGVAVETARKLAEKLDVTVLLTGEAEVPPLAAAEFPVIRGRARAASGWLGAFEVLVDGFAAPSPASRGALRWGRPRDGAKSSCDVLLDLTGAAPLFSAHEVRQGYLRADPADSAAVAEAVWRAADLLGAFDKPRYVAFDAGLCAHSRNRRTGCTRCLDLCPTGAITPGKDSVVISAEICAGCGACAAICPTGAAQYALPPADAWLNRLRALLLTYREAGGADPVVLIHDNAHGAPLLDALAHHGDGLPARVLPIAVNEVTQLDLSAFAAAFAWGACAVRVLARGRRARGSDGLFRNIDMANAAALGMGLTGPAPRALAIETDDPFTLGEALFALPAMALPFAPESFLPVGAPREILRTAFRALHRAAKAASPVIPMPAAAPFGEARVATEGCTLCLACTTVCPTGAFGANPEKPQLSFLEDACVQCGLCVATCPEKVISLVPRLNLAPEAAERRVVKEEEPFPCARCAKPFGMRSSVERVKAKLAAHWMFGDAARLRIVELCEDCRVAEATTGGLDPYAGGERPVTKTSEDYLREAEREKRREEG